MSLTKLEINQFFNKDNWLITTIDKTNHPLHGHKVYLHKRMNKVMFTEEAIKNMHEFTGSLLTVMEKIKLLNDTGKIQPSEEVVDKQPS